MGVVVRIRVRGAFMHPRSAVVASRDPTGMIPLKESSAAQFEGFGEPEAGLGTTVRRAAGTGTVRLERTVFGADSEAFPCTVGVMSGSGAGPFTVSLDGKALAPAAHLHRFQLPPLGDAGRDNAVRELRIDSLPVNPTIILTGLFFTACEDEAPKSDDTDGHSDQATGFPAFLYTPADGGAVRTGQLL